MMSENEIKTRNIDKKRIEALEEYVQLLSSKLNALTSAIRQSAHIMGWPQDVLERQGIKAFDKDSEKLQVNGRQMPVTTNGLTAKHKNRRIRQEALREQLASQGHIQHVIEILDEVNDPDSEIDQNMLQRKKLVVDTKLKLINKYLPDLKSVEVVDEDGNDALPKSIVINVRATDTDT